MFNPYPLRFLSAAARQSARFLSAQWRFTHRILTVALPPRSPLLRLFALPQGFFPCSSVSFSRFARVGFEGVPSFNASVIISNPAALVKHFLL